MKKFITLAIICVLGLVSLILIFIESGCGISDKSDTDNIHVTYHTIFAERIQLANSFEELESVSDVIVKATVAEGKENITKAMQGDPNLIYNGYTKTALLIDKVLKGNIVSDEITITEEYYTLYVDNETQIWSQGNYLPAKEGNTYLFFLKQYEDSSEYAGMYYPIDLEMGKYPINGTEKLSTVSELELKPESDITRYEEWYQKAYDKYIKETVYDLVPPGTLPEVATIPQPDQSEVTSVGTYSFDTFDVTSFAYFYNQKSKEERLVLVEGGAGRAVKYVQLLILETDFGGATGLKSALNEPFQAKLLAYKNISFQEGQYAYNASLAVGCAEEERIDLKSEFKNETENQMYFGNVRSSYPEYPSDAIVAELNSGRFAMIATNVKEEESEGLKKNKEIYERIFERFGLDEIGLVDNTELENKSEVHSSNVSRVEVNSLLYGEYFDLKDTYHYEPKYNAAQWMNEAGELLFPYEQELNNDTKMADDLALLYMPDEILLKASTEDLLKVVMDGWLETNATSISVYSIPSHYIRSCTIKNQAANELMRRSDMVTVLYEDYCNRNYLKGEESREGRWAADKLQFDEIILASNHAFAMMDDEMKENVLNAALEKHGQVRSGYFYTVGHTSGFFAYIVEEELNGGSDWYQYIHDNNIEAAKNAISFNDTCWLEQFY